MSREQRRHDRYQVRMPVSLASGRQTLEARTVDISFGGFFVTCEPLPPARQLVKAKFPVAGKRGKTFELMAMPVFLDPQGRVAGKPGCGLQLFGVDDAVRKQWEQLVRYAQALPEASGDSSEDIDLGHGPSEDWPEVRREIWVHVPDHEALKRLVSLELARGRLHARCTTELAPGTEIELHIVHPSSGRSYRLHAEVERQVRDETFSGLRLRVPPLPDGVRTELERFVDGSGGWTIDLDPGALGPLAS